jgi:tetratricopeptide (TPR) repeat protein
MKKISLLFFVLVIALKLSASENDVFKIGNDAYLKNNFETAISSYKQLEKEGYQSSELYFNLGNAYYKTDSIANAILYYERAKKLAPMDEDVLVNLKLANLKTIDKTEAKEQLIFKSWWINFVSSKSADAWGVLTLVFLFISFAFLIVFRLAVSSFSKQLFFTAFSVSFIAAGCFFFLAKTNDTMQKEAGQAILFNSSATIKSAPTESAKDLFIIHEGAKVNIIEKDNNWFRIRLDNGNEGWLPENAVRLI